MKKVLAVILVLAMAFAMVACGAKPETISDLEIAADGSLIGISLPTQSSERWIKDGGKTKEILEGKGFKVDLQYAEDDIPTKKSQIEAMLAKGAKVLVVVAIDGSTLSATLDSAAKDGVKIISYDRLLVDTDAASYYATFDNRGAGKLQAESLIEGLKAKKCEGLYNIEVFAGSPDDTNSFYFYEGAMDVLKPLIDDGTSCSIFKSTKPRSGWNTSLERCSCAVAYGCYTCSNLHRRQST